MNPNAIEPWCPSDELKSLIERLKRDLNLTESARTYIDAALRGPSRQVQGRRGNVLTRFISKKTGGSLMLESRRGEWAAAVMLENDATVKAFLAQPPAISLQPTDASGKVLTTAPYTPDFIVFRETGLTILEVRDDSALHQKALSNPHQFYVDESHQWHFRAAEEFFTKEGFEYRILANGQLPTTLINNARHLQSHQERAVEVDGSQLERLRAYVAEKRLVRYLDMIDQNLFTADQLLDGVIHGAVYVDLMTVRLAAVHELELYSDAATGKAAAMAAAGAREAPLPIAGTMLIRPGAQIEWQGKKMTVILVGEVDLIVQDDTGVQLPLNLATVLQLHRAKALTGGEMHPSQLLPQIADFHPEELNRASARLDAVRGRAGVENYSERSLSRYRAMVATAQSELEALIALVDKSRDRGNRDRRLSELAENLAERAIEERFNIAAKPPKSVAYLRYVTLCEDAKDTNGQLVLPMSYPTFCKRCDQYGSVKSREGKRAAYQKSAIHQSLNNAYPVNGTRPHEICYMDHTVATISTQDVDGTPLGKPTLSAAIDGYSRNARAFILTYDPPSTRTVLLLLRDYVRRHGRLPRVIVVDNGKEFHSHELEHFCRVYGIEIRYRPPAMPRGGCQIERLLGAVEMEVLAPMDGNTRQMRDPRLMTGEINPFRHTVWTLTAIYNAIDQYLFKVRPGRHHAALGMSPTEFEQEAFRRNGGAQHRLVRYDENLMFQTCPHTARRHHKIDRRRGVWVDGAYHRHPDMDLQPNKRPVEVRYEPWSADVIYVLLKKGWVPAIASSRNDIRDRTRRELEIARRAARRKGGVNARQAYFNKETQEFKERLASPLNFDERIAKQQREMKELYSTMGLGAVTQISEQPVQPELLLAPAAGSEVVTVSAVPQWTPSANEPGFVAPVAERATAPVNEVIYDNVFPAVAGYF